MYRLLIREYRIIRNYTQEELAEKIGISRNHLSALERGDRDMKFSLAVKIADALDVCLRDLIEKVEDETNESGND